MKLSKLLNQSKNNKEKGVGKNIAKNGLKAVLTMFIPKILIVSTAAILISSFFDYVIELVTAKSTPQTIYDKLEVESMADLVEVKEDGNGGYYLDFKEDTDEKLSKIVKFMNSKAGVHNLPDSEEFLKKLIKAEVITQFPNLGGQVPDNSDGFQGAVKIRRVTPDKEIGEVKNTGSGETTALEDDVEYDTEDKSDYEDIVKQWQAGKKLVINSQAIVYEQTASKLNPGSDTGDWNPVYDEKSSGNLKLKVNTEVEYTGTYKTNKNLMNKKVVTYVEVKTGDTTGFVKAQFLSEKEEQKNSSIVRKVAKINNAKTSRAKEEKKTAGNKDEEYVIAIAAGHNNTDNTGAHNGDLKEEELTIKVAEKVEELFKDYSNVKVVQTGSTKSNPGGIKKEERTKLARDANPDLCIQIHFNSGGGTGVEAIYKDGDECSAQLAELLSEAMSNSMGIKNRKAGTDLAKSNKSLGIIESYAKSGFPSVVTEGGFIDGDAKLVGSDDGIEKYAKGIVDGVVKYLGTDHKGTSATTIEEQKVSNGVTSIVKNLKYVPKEKMDEYIKNGDKEALNVFTLDEENKVITATWSIKDDGNTEISTNSAMDLKTALQKYAVPFEYLLYFYMDTNEPYFSEDLADKILETDIVMAVQDNITTIRDKQTTQEKSIPAKPGKSSDWQDTDKTSTKVTESVNTIVDITYVNAWCVKAYKTNSYSDAALKMGDEDEKKIDISGKVTESDTTTMSAEQHVRTDETKKMVTTTNEYGDIVTEEEITKHKIYQRTRTDTKTIANTYESGDLKTEEQIGGFVDLYKENKMANLVREQYLFTIIENNEKTANLLDLTKYLIYKSTGRNFGVVEYDFSVFDLQTFSETSSSTGGLDTFIEYLHTWEGNEGLSPDGTKYKVGDDGAGHPTVGYGVDIYNSGYLDRFKAAGYDVSMGSYIDKDFVDAIEREEIESKLQAIEKETAGLNLTTYQKYALLSRAYNCGTAGAIKSRNGKTFVQAYNAYWNQERDDEYKVTPNEGMYTHSLFTTYMNKPDTSGGKTLNGLVKRRRSEWILFKTGYYDNIDKWCSESEGGSIVEKAIEVHNYLRSNGYHYAQTGGAVPRTSSKAIDCSSYVTWVLVEANVSGFTSGMAQWTSAKFATNPLGWQEVSANDAQPGDIVVYSGHVEIIAKNDPSSTQFRVYNCGSNNSINADGGNSGLPESSNSGRNKSTAVKILRVPQ